MEIKMANPSKFAAFFNKKAVNTTPKSGLAYFKFAKNDVTYRLRALPWKNGDQDGMPVVVRHYHAVTIMDAAGNKKFNSVPCRKKNNEGACPFCKYASKLWQEWEQTQSIAARDAAKSLFCKTDYLTVVANVADMVTLSTPPTVDNLLLFSIGSKTNKGIVDGRLERGHDFADFTTGRDILARKASGSDMGTVAIEFDDADEAFGGDRALYDQLYDLIPDLSHLLTISEADVTELFTKFTSGAEETPEPDERKAPEEAAATLTLDDLRRRMELGE